MTLNKIHDWIGSDKHIFITACLKEVRRTTSVETTQSDGVMRTVFRTPHGETMETSRFDPASQSWHPAQFPVRNRDQVRLMTAVFDDATVELDQGRLAQARAEAAQTGQDALTCHNIGTSPLMDWVQHLAGVENAHLLLADCPEEVETLFDAMHRVLLRKTGLLCEYSPADALYLTENTSTTLISPDQYRRYCARHVGECAQITSRARRILILHMCGHLKALLTDLARIPANAFEAFTSPTLGNTTLLDGRTRCPDKCLVGGTNATLWTRPASEIIARLQADLGALSHHGGIVVTSAGVMPPLCTPETIRQVADWVKEYPPRMNGV